MSTQYEYVRETLAGLLGGAMAGGTAVVSVLQDTPLKEVTDSQWITICVGSFLAAAQAWKQLLSRPPRRME
jgi:hypothetical protein